MPTAPSSKVAGVYFEYQYNDLRPSPVKTLSLIFVLLAASLPSHAEVVESVPGKFHVCADDNAVVFLNGAEIFKVHYEGSHKVTESGHLVLKIGDHLVFQLNNDGGGARGLFAQFVSADGKTVISFPRQAFRILVNPQAMAFSDTEFRNLREAKAAKTGLGMKLLPFKSRSEWVWGEQDNCAVGIVISRDLLGPVVP